MTARRAPASKEWRVGVVGAGVAGLSCARRLRRGGAQVEVYEASDGVGGRLRSDVVQMPGAGAFLLDRGFQILIEAYPEVREQLDLDRLALKAFAPGAYLAYGRGELRTVADPLRAPRYLWQTLTCGLASVRDLLALLRLRLGQLLWETAYSALEEPEESSTEQYLRRLGLSDSLVERFLRPFFEAIYVTPLKEQSSRCFRFVLRMLAEGRTSLPAEGMQAIPRQLAEGLQIELESKVTEVLAKQIKLGEVVKAYDAVVLAADRPRAQELLPELGLWEGTSSSTWYFAMREPPVREPLIVLNSTLQDGSSSRLVDVAFPSLVQPSYAPAGWHLAAVTLRGEEPKEDWVRQQLSALFLADVSTWKLLRVYRIGFHQPAQQRLGRPPRTATGVYVCGDHCQEPTLDAAMRSGRLAAEAVLQDLT